MAPLTSRSGVGTLSAGAAVVVSIELDGTEVAAVAGVAVVVVVISPLSLLSSETESFLLDLEVFLGGLFGSAAVGANEDSDAGSDFSIGVLFGTLLSRRMTALLLSTAFDVSGWLASGSC